MPITVEIVGSRDTTISVDDPRQDLIFLVQGTDDDGLAAAQVENDLTPTITLTSAFFGTVTIVIQSYRIQHQGNGVWNGSAKYGRRQPRQTGDLIFTFDGTGGTRHVQVSKETVATFKSSTFTGTVPDYKQAIGVNDQMVAGVDTTVAIYKFSIEYYPATALVNAAYVATLQSMAGTVNDDTWGFTPTNFPDRIEFDEGEVLFLGATGQPRSLDDWQISMHFIGSANYAAEDELNLGDIKNIVQEGHEYLWAQFGNSTSGNKLIKIPQIAFVERVYDKDDFAKLGIGS